jgi:hypothetical protein
MVCIDLSISVTKHVCACAPWFINMCELYDLYILNGIHSPAAYTWHKSRGESTVDYILCSKLSIKVTHTPLQACKITDHCLMFTTLPMGQASACPPAQSGVPSPAIPETATASGGSAPDHTTYQWVEGSSLKEYGTSAV